jgi:ribosome-binding protein aMBF1 (putative translation factor)
VCDSCARDHGENERTTGNDSSRDEQNRKRKAAQNAAKLQDAQRADTSHWEDGADYDDDQLPYLVSKYGERVTEARQDEGLQTSELAEELDLDDADILAVEQGRATQANVGGSTIKALEQYLDIDLVESN